MLARGPRAMKRRYFTTRNTSIRSVNAASRRHERRRADPNGARPSRREPLLIAIAIVLIGTPTRVAAPVVVRTIFGTYTRVSLSLSHANEHKTIATRRDDATRSDRR